MERIRAMTRSTVVVCIALLALAGCGKKDEVAKPTVGGTPSAVPTDLKSGDGVPAKVVKGPDFDNTLVSASDIKNIKNDEYVVTGTKKFDGWFLKADRIVFEPGATLVFSRTALSNRRQFWVVAKELVVKDQANPGTITWEQGDPPSPPQAPGEAPPGKNGPQDGAAGLPGNEGTKGSPGLTGANAPQITLVVLKVPGSGVIVNLTGGNGGQGGPGMKGGRGGTGAKGHPASQIGFGCNRGAGNGGSGGGGGKGGPGGDGGVGGAGGTFLLVSEAEILPSLTQKFRVKVAAGTGGSGGQGGQGGDGGPGGPGGQEARPYCRGNGSQGANGGPGGSGSVGSPGGVGQEGDFTIGGATKEQLDSYIWPTK
jgi:hypothetical protein